MEHLVPVRREQTGGYSVNTALAHHALVAQKWLQCTAEAVAKSNGSEALPYFQVFELTNYWTDVARELCFALLFARSKSEWFAQSRMPRWRCWLILTAPG